MIEASGRHQAPGEGLVFKGMLVYLVEWASLSLTPIVLEVAIHL